LREVCKAPSPTLFFFGPSSAFVGSVVEMHYYQGIEAAPRLVANWNVVSKTTKKTIDKKTRPEKTILFGIFSFFFSFLRFSLSFRRRRHSPKRSTPFTHPRNFIRCAGGLVCISFGSNSGVEAICLGFFSFYNESVFETKLWMYFVRKTVIRNTSWIWSTY
jgi:hypothetical protein